MERLRDHKPEKKRQVKAYKPPKPLSGLSCGIVIALGCLLLVFALAVLGMRLFGVYTEASTFTKLDENGAVVPAPPATISASLPVTFADREGVTHEHVVSLLGNTGTVGETIAIRYLPGHPQIVMPASRTDEFMIPLGSLLLGAILISAACSRLREIRAGREESREEEK